MKSNYFRNGLLNHIFRAASFPSLSTGLHLALFTSANSESGGGTEVSGGSYARLAVTRNTSNWKDAATSTVGQANNLGLLTWPQATGNWGKVIDIAVMDDPSAGNIWYYAPLILGLWLPFTAAASTDVLTIPGHTFANGDAVRLIKASGPALPTGLSEGTEYFVRDVSGATLKLTATVGGAAIDLTADGSGCIAKSGAKIVSQNDTFTIPVGNLLVAEI